MNEVTPSVCVTCQTDLASYNHPHFCPNCGQEQRAQRYSLLRIVMDVLAIITNVERGFWLTAADMTYRPAKVITGFWKGQTRKYFHPFRYAFVMATLASLTTISTGVYDRQMEEVKTGNNSWISGMNTAPQSEDQMAMALEVQEQVRKYLSLISLLIIPFAGFGVWLLFKDQGIYFGEQMVAASYFTGQTSALGILITLVVYLFGLSGSTHMTMSMVVDLFYGLFVIRTLYKVPIWRTVLSVPAVFLVVVISAMVVSIAIGLIIAAIF